MSGLGPREAASLPTFAAKKNEISDLRRFAPNPEITATGKILLSPA
jgi:hypothetical protein